MFTRNNDWLFILLPLGIFVNLYLGWNLKDFISPDSKSYIEIAKNLPRLNNSIFPILYPTVLRFINFFSADYLISYKIVNVFILLFIVLFVRIKNFYWKEIWTILTFASFQTIYCYAWSENIILLFIILMCYINKVLLFDNENSKFFIIQSVTILTLMFLTKYSSIFYLFAYLAFAIYLHVVKDRKKSILYLKTFIVSCCLFAAYLLVNKFFTSHFTGQRTTIFEEMSFPRYTFLSFLNVPSTITPATLSFTKIFYQEKYLNPYPILWKVPLICSIIIIGYLFYVMMKLRSLKYSKYLEYLLFSSITFLILSFVSAYFTRIDVLSARLLLGFYSFFLIGSIHFLKLNKIKLTDTLLLGIGLYSLIVYGFSIFHNGFV